MKYLIVFALFVAIGTLDAQCFQDRHNTSVASSWLSCEASENPNPTRESGHWIQYDLGENKVLLDSYFWNVNAPDHLTSGAKTIIIDYSFDGTSWVEYGSWNMDQANGSGFYEGQAGPNFNNLEARFILFTVTENYGGDCFGLGEIKIFVKESVAVVDFDKTDMPITLSPNPATSYTDLHIHSNYTGLAQVQILDISGKELFKMPIDLTGAEQVSRLSTADLADGQYIVRLSNSQLDYGIEFTKVNNN